MGNSRSDNVSAKNMRGIMRLGIGLLIALTASLAAASYTGVGSDGLLPGERFEYVFGDVGRFDYFCQEHENMKGSVIVDDSPGALAEDVTVAIVGFQFVDQEVRVKPGTKVTWINGDNAYHTVTASPSLRPMQPKE